VTSLPSEGVYISFLRGFRVLIQVVNNIGSFNVLRGGDFIVKIFLDYCVMIVLDNITFLMI